MTATDLKNLMPKASELSNVVGKGAKSQAGGSNDIFAGLMNQVQKTSSPSATESKPQSNVGESYEVYGSKINKNVKNVEDANGTDQVSDNPEVKDALETLEKELVQEIAKELDMDPEELVELMTALGMKPLDMLQPENLAKLYMECNNQMDATMVVTCEQFQELLSQVKSLGEEVRHDLSMDKNQFAEAVSMMEALEQPVELDESMANELMAQDSATHKINEVTTEAVETDIPLEEDGQAQQVETMEEAVTTVEDTDTQSVMKQESFDQRGEDTFHQETGTQTGSVVMSDNSSVSNAEIPEAPHTYMDITDTIQLIRQLADNVRVAVSTDTQWMEMQLNPENLGKMLLHVSQKEGAVSAQITTQNEIVRENLMLQMANLQERLESAGLKVDAIEITVSSHAFEQNLEQGQNRQEQDQAAEHRNTGSTRRNLNLSELDGLSGLMSEEEQLVAQIMRDNGNSVDFTA
ncbi:MAG: flagellar hook-length control protein FliK [Agathobacter sp.]|nr:flagellar hook-length control protein FliK [Agathobacter sp.]